MIKPKSDLTGDILGGTAAMLVALPSAIAFGLIIFAPLGSEFSGKAAIAGIIGTIALGLVSPVFGGTFRLVTAPCAPAAAVLAVFVAEILTKENVPLEAVPIYVTMVALFAGIFQLVLGKVGGGKFIKYIPYPVIAGYLSAVGILIFTGQFPKLLGLSKDIKFIEGISLFNEWKWESIGIGLVTIVVMLASSKLIKNVPAAIVALSSGVACYFGISFFEPELLTLENNALVIGTISASVPDIYRAVIEHWSYASLLTAHSIVIIAAPALTLAVILSIDTLKTCVVLDALTMSRHDSNKELEGQGLGNISSALLSGIPGAGTMGATLVNLNSGGKTRMSGVFVGLTALLVLLLFGKLVAWIPFASLAGILIVVAVKMIDVNSFTLLKHRTTVFDFFVILAVVLSAVIFSLIVAAGVGIAMAILLFLREQMRTSVIRRISFGNMVFSKKARLSEERALLEEMGKHTLIIELQGQLFFGTADQLLSEIEPVLSECKYAVLDMRRVQSVDFTAAYRIKQILARVKLQKGFLIFASVPRNLPTGQNVKKYLERLGLTETQHLKFFDDLDSALQWTEDETISAHKLVEDKKILELREIELFSGISEQALINLSDCMEEKSFNSGEAIFRAGDQTDEIFFVRKGNVKIVLPLAGGMFHHLVTVTKGGFFGDMAFLDKRRRSADAIAMDEVFLFVLPRNKFDEVAQKHPEVSGVFFEKLAFAIANRLRQSDKELKALQEN